MLTGAAAAADVPAGTSVVLDGQSLLEELVAAGAQSPQEVAGRFSHELLRMALNNSQLPDRLMANRRAVRRFELSQRAQVERYRDQLQAAINQSRSRHSLEDWLRGAALATRDLRGGGRVEINGVLGLVQDWALLVRRI